jgi:hypothetical protein
MPFGSMNAPPLIGVAGAAVTMGENATNRAAYLVKSLFTEVPSATIGHAAALMSIA